MRDELLLLLTIISLLIFAGAAVRESLRRRWIRRLERLALDESHRNRFGELRTRLMALARDGVVEPRSEEFASVYAGLSVMMRQPCMLDIAVQALLGLPPPPKKSAAKYHRRMPREMARLLLDLAEQLDRLCRDYHGSYRWLARLIDLHNPTKVYLWERLQRCLESNHKYVKVEQIRSVEKALRQRAEPILEAA